MSKIAIRTLSSSARSLSHVGSTPITIPHAVTLHIPTSSNRAAASSSRSISVTGPLGSKSLTVPADVMLFESGPQLSIEVRDATDRRQRSLWGLTRSLINNAVLGVSEGFRLELRMVGVGYRGAVEPIPQSVLEMRRNMPGAMLQTSINRLNLKLGYAHPILIDIPSDITVTFPTPTTIVLSGSDKQQLGLFAAKIRRWRKPEPYRGKGVFIGDETIKLKEIKKK